MRRPSLRMRKTLVTLMPRVQVGVDSRGLPIIEYANEGVGYEVRGTMQPLGDTGRRQSKETADERLSSLEGWRLFLAHEDLVEAGLDPTLISPIRENDQVIYHGQKYRTRGELVPQSHRLDGSVLDWSVDLDGRT